MNKELNNKTVMVIGGGEWQVPLIEKAKSMGLIVINTNLYEDSPGFKLADAGLVANVLDKDRNLSIANQYSPDAVITDQSDIAVPTVAYICEELNLHGISTQVAESFTNKHLMRQVCEKYGFSTPDFKLCKSLAEIQEFVDEVGLPVVVKPPASQSSRGVVKVTELGLLQSAFNSALAFSQTGEVLVEGFIGGVELTVDGIKTNSAHFCLATSVKSHYEHNEMVANQLVFTNTHPEIDFNALHLQHNDLIEKMALPFGITHAEYKYFDDQFYLIEVAARGGGTRLSSDIVPLMSGVDSNDLYIKMALGQKLEKIHVDKQDRVVVMDFLSFEPGRVSSILGFAEALTWEGVHAIGLNFSIGDEILPPEDDRSRHGYVIAYATSLEKVFELLGNIRKMIKVEYA